MYIHLYTIICRNVNEYHKYMHKFIYIMLVYTPLTWRLSPCELLNVTKFHFKRWKSLERWLLGDWLVTLQRDKTAAAVTAVAVVAAGENTWDGPWLGSCVGFSLILDWLVADCSHWHLVSQRSSYLHVYLLLYIMHAYTYVYATYIY